MLKAHEIYSRQYKAIRKLTPPQFQLLVRKAMMVSFTLSRNDVFVQLVFNKSMFAIPAYRGSKREIHSNSSKKKDNHSNFPTIFQKNTVYILTFLFFLNESTVNWKLAPSFSVHLPIDGMITRWIRSPVFEKNCRKGLIKQFRRITMFIVSTREWFNNT